MKSSSINTSRSRMGMDWKLRSRQIRPCDGSRIARTWTYSPEVRWVGVRPYSRRLAFWGESSVGYDVKSPWLSESSIKQFPMFKKNCRGRGRTERRSGAKRGQPDKRVRTETPDLLFPPRLLLLLFSDSLLRLQATQTLQKMTAVYEVAFFFLPKSGLSLWISFFFFLFTSVFNSAEKVVIHYTLAHGPNTLALRHADNCEDLWGNHIVRW